VLNSFYKFTYKATRYEFWPWYLMFVPVMPVYFFGVLRTRKLLYFTAANPSIDMGGFFGEKKDEILALIPEKYKVRGVHVQRTLNAETAKQLLLENQFNFPVVLKPNVGERGRDVRVIHTLEEMVAYSSSQEDYLVQEYIDYPIELGVLYSKLPNASSGEVTSITEKAFLTVIGDGKSTVGDLLKSSPRNSIYYEVVVRDFPKKLHTVPAMGERYVVHRIGNHIKGTRFIDANKHITPKLNAVFTKMGDEVNGVFYGRYDLKVPTYADLEAGQNIKIFELNGVSSEPGHIYDQTNVFKAYYGLAEHWLRLIEVSHQNMKKGVKTTPLSKFLLQVKNHFWR
jgi:hypothetical protein